MTIIKLNKSVANLDEINVKKKYLLTFFKVFNWKLLNFTDIYCI